MSAAPPMPPRPTGGPPRPPGATPPPTPGVNAVTQSGRTDEPVFTYNADDIAAAADDLLASLPPIRKIEVDPSAPRRTFAFVGPKGMKTIASLAINTPKSPGVPRPKGSLVVCIHTDTQSANSFDNYLFLEGIELEDSEKPFFIGVAEPKGAYKARLRRSDPACSAYVRDVILEVLQRLAARGDVGLCVFDGYGDFCNQYGGYVAAYEVGLPSPIKLEGTQWYARREMFEELLTGGRASVVPGGAFVVNGPEGGLEQEREKEPTKLKKRLAKEGFVGREPPSKWLLYRENSQNLDVIVVGEIVVGGASGKRRYLASVWEGRHARIGFYNDAEADLTGKNIGAFTENVPTPPSPNNSTEN